MNDKILFLIQFCGSRLWESLRGFVTQRYLIKIFNSRNLFLKIENFRRVMILQDGYIYELKTRRFSTIGIRRGGSKWSEKLREKNGICYASFFCHGGYSIRRVGIIERYQAPVVRSILCRWELSSLISSRRQAAAANGISKSLACPERNVSPFRIGGHAGRAPFSRRAARLRE